MPVDPLASLIPPERPAPGTRVLVAFSGGPDSTVLLHALHRLGGYTLAAVHVHHGLQSVADDWAIHCERTCEALGVPLTVARVRIAPHDPQGPEGAAREARYAAFREAMRPGDVLATAHHQDDQAETVLLRLLRGSGPRGLGGMRSMREFPPGRLWRPLLAHSRERLRTHAAALSPLPVDDPHNADPRYARSYLRQALMPLVAARWPGVTGNLARAAALEQEAASLLDALADEDLARLQAAGAHDATALPIAALRGFEPARRRNLVRRWIETKGLPVPYRDTLLRLEAEVLDARPEGEPCLAWPGAELRRYRDALVAMPTLPPPPRDVALGWDGEGLLTLPDGCGRLEGERIGACVVHVPAPAGTRFQPAGAPHHRTLKNLYQERGIPPWARERTPAIERDGRVAWIGGIGWADGERAGTIDWLDAF